jgi:hypothetical protein
MITWRPVNQATYAFEPFLRPLVVTATVDPAAGVGGVSVRPGRDLTGSFGFDEGQLLMN